MKEIKITVPEGFEIDKENSTFEKIIFKETVSLLEKVFIFNKTTEKDFNENHKNCSEFTKDIAIEEMIVNFYNKGEIIDVNNTKQIKWYLWFYLGKDFRLGSCCNCNSCSFVPARLCHKSREIALYSAKQFIHIWKDAFNS